jgi:PAS domain S-box-containing protein
MQGEADPFWVISSTTDATGRCTYLDERWRGFTGQDPSEALGYGWLDVLHPDDRDKTVETLRSVLDMSKPFRIEFRVRRPDGAYCWALAAGAPRFDESGACLGYVGSIVDIEDRRTTEAWLAAGEERQAVPAKAAAEAAEPRSAAKLRALVIDDNPDVTDSLVMLMESLGAEVRAAYDGTSGVEAAMEFRPNLAFIDIRMPGVDGHETARRLRARLGRDTPTLVALTGLGQDKDRKLSQEAGFDMHLTKPVAAQALEALFRRAQQPTL